MTPQKALNLLNDTEFAEKHQGKEEYTEMLLMCKEALEKQIPKKPYSDNDNGIYEKDCCPTCHRSLFPNDHHCRCGQALDWSDTE